MNSGATTERVYDAIRRRILEHGFRPDERLDPAQLADAHLSSVTPVREALNQLAGEGIVVSRSGGGFYLPSLDEPALKDLYAWSADLVWIALRQTKTEAHHSAVAPGATTPADRTAALFEAVAASSANAEHGRAVAGLNGRMHAIRLAETQVLSDVDVELDELEAAWSSGRPDLFRRRSDAYHRRRRREAGRIVRAVYRA